MMDLIDFLDVARSATTWRKNSKLHAHKLLCASCAGAAYEITMWHNSTSCIDPQRKIEIHRMLLYEPLQALNVKNNPMTLLSFQPRDTTKLKGWSTSSKYMCHQKHQERHPK